MRRTTWSPLVVIAAALALAASGCITSSDDPAPGLSAADQTVDLDAEFGGFNTANEAPAFGDAELADTNSLTGEGDEGVDFDDAMARERHMIRLSDHPEVDVYALRVMWGTLDRDLEDVTFPAPVDWSGSLSLERGGLLVRRVLRFEPIQGDHIVRPREDRRVIEWVSTTIGGRDGLLVAVFDPQLVLDDSSGSDDTATAVGEAYTTPNVITFETEPLTVSFNVSSLADLDTVVEVGGSNLAVAFRGIRIEPGPYPCPSGFLGGVWKRAPDTEGGVFYGRWMGADGRVAGYLRGHYGVNSDGRKVFFGKYIDLSGRFRGFLRGRWENLPDLPGGRFHGVWFDALRRPRGELGGRYLVAPDGGRGTFHGRWRAYCR
jgi:hypothetical protein